MDTGPMGHTKYLTTGCTKSSEEKIFGSVWAQNSWFHCGCGWEGDKFSPWETESVI